MHVDGGGGRAASGKRINREPEGGRETLEAKEGATAVRVGIN